MVFTSAEATAHHLSRVTVSDTCVIFAQYTCNDQLEAMPHIDSESPLNKKVILTLSWLQKPFTIDSIFTKMGPDLGLGNQRKYQNFTLIFFREKKDKLIRGQEGPH